ncbi:S-layer homology domain-containing protein [Halobacillus alkaliphilus]|uniref:S-layer homology domain-containing protein n=1 Tax=Halobacillus alkaliphilus TaxID=396056 RepID=A0A1I2JXQ8_9BACI|nr:C40 family peptidase [Halobacillus alkaliphilus]SFF58858.1 S-layer homology domain-containing protein [Halobacillus alkaliphilus]
MKKALMSLLAFSMVFLLFVPNSLAGSRIGNQIVDLAFKYDYAPYVWGGTSTSGFDCSGYTQYVYDKAGIDLPRTSRSQYGEGDYVRRSNLQPGDLVFFGDPIWHVGIYIGNNKMISAENPSDDITVASLTGYWDRNYRGAKRVADVGVSSSSLPTGSYHDLDSNHWSADAVSSLSKQGIIDGYDGDLFKPKNDVTRAEAAKMLADALDLDNGSGSSFNDVSSSHWASDYIEAAADEGYLSGYGDGSFKPSQSITRAEIASIFARAFNLNSYGSNPFYDVSSSHWAYDDIKALNANDITEGYEDGSFRVNNEATRSEFAVFLYRAL